MEEHQTVELIDAVVEFLETEYPAVPYAYKTKVNLVGKELVEFMVNSRGAVRYFVYPHPTYDETIVKTAIKQLRNELR